MNAALPDQLQQSGAITEMRTLTRRKRWRTFWVWWETALFLLLTAAVAALAFYWEWAGAAI